MCRHEVKEKINGHKKPVQQLPRADVKIKSSLTKEELASSGANVDVESVDFKVKMESSLSQEELASSGANVDVESVDFKAKMENGFSKDPLPSPPVAGGETSCDLLSAMKCGHGKGKPKISSGSPVCDCIVLSSEGGVMCDDILLDIKIPFLSYYPCVYLWV